MKKLFPLRAPGRVDARVVDAVKHEVRKYVKRERRKELPEDFTEWQFRCKVGPTRDSATSLELGSLAGAIDDVARTGATEVYIEILAEAGHRTMAPKADTPPSS